MTLTANTDNAVWNNPSDFMTYYTVEWTVKGATFHFWIRNLSHTATHLQVVVVVVLVLVGSTVFKNPNASSFQNASG